ncbi:MAG: hypothetical protein V5A74_03280 [Desulfohalobiaceae bacterium]
MITPISSTATSAIAAYWTRQQASAHNLANTNTDGFEPIRVTLAEKADQNGVRVQDTRTQAESAPGEPQDKVTLSQQARQTSGEEQQAREEPSEAEVAEEMVRMQENREAYAANASAA